MARRARLPGRCLAFREVLIEINDILWRGVSLRGANLDAAFSEPSSARYAFDSMPNLDVSVSLKAAYHRNPAHRWKPNHIQDIDALASTVPYCDIVVTDKEAASHLDRTGGAERLRTTVLSRTADLIQYL